MYQAAGGEEGVGRAPLDELHGVQEFRECSICHYRLRALRGYGTHDELLFSTQSATSHAKHRGRITYGSVDDYECGERVIQ